MSRHLWAILAMIAMSCAACSGPSAENDSEESTATSPAPPVSAADGTGTSQSSETSKLNLLPQDDVAKTRQSLEGKWILQMTQGATDFTVALLDVTKSSDNQSNGPYAVSILEEKGVMPSLSIASAKTTDNELDIVFNVGEGPDSSSQLSIQCELKDGAILGSSMYGMGSADAVSLVPTDETSLDAFENMQESAGREEFVSAMNSFNRFDSLVRFVEENPESPLVLLAYEQILRLVKSSDLEESEVDDLVKRYFEIASRWGPRMESSARVMTGYNLAATMYDPEVSLRYLKEAEEKLSEANRETFMELIKAGRKQAEMIQAVAMITSADEARQDQGAERLRNFRTENPMDPVIVASLAQYEEAKGNIGAALSDYAEIVVLPMMENGLLELRSQLGTTGPLPSEAVSRLWQEKHGSTDGLDDFLKKIYSERIVRFADAPIEDPATSGNGQIALLELFTGAQCPPCVAADVATAGIEHTYPQTQAIVLRYHQHIPGPDPLTNSDTEARFGYYQGRGTPTLALNGQIVDNPGGFLVHVRPLYERIRGLLDDAIDQESSIGIELSANAADGVLNVDAKVTGVEDRSDIDSLRLRLVLVEEEVDYMAGNGIRQHEMLVRGMVGGPDGVPAQDGKLQLSEKLDLAELKSGLQEYLTEFEQGNQYNFAAKPLELQPLYVVGFVQSDEDKTILQTAIVPVEGELKYPEDVADEEQPSPAID